MVAQSLQYLSALLARIDDAEIVQLRQQRWRWPGQIGWQFQAQQQSLPGLACSRLWQFGPGIGRCRRGIDASVHAGRQQLVVEFGDTGQRRVNSQS